MRAQGFSARDFKKVLSRNGYVLKRNCKSSHTIWTNGEKIIIFPATKVNRMMARRLIKEYELNV